MNTITGLLIDGGLAGSLGWIIAAGMILGVILGNGMMKSMFGKLMLFTITYLVIQETARYSYFQHVNPGMSILTPIGLTLIVSSTYIFGIIIGRILLYFSGKYLAKKGEQDEIVNPSVLNDIKLD